MFPFVTFSSPFTKAECCSECYFLSKQDKRFYSPLSSLRKMGMPGQECSREWDRLQKACVSSAFNLHLTVPAFRSHSTSGRYRRSIIILPDSITIIARIKLQGSLDGETKVFVLQKLLDNIFITTVSLKIAAPGTATCVSGVMRKNTTRISTIFPK